MPIAANPTPELLGRLADNEASRTSVVTIQRAYSLGETASAFGDFASGTLGKLVVDVAAGSDPVTQPPE